MIKWVYIIVNYKGYIVSFRYWNPIWGRLFDSLLNIPSCEQQPSLRDFREEFEKLYQMDEANYTRQKQRHDRLMF